MKDIMETVINNLQYIYPGFIIMYIYQFVRGSKVEDVNIFFLKDICISYILVTFIDSIIEIFFEISNNGIVTFVKHTLLIILSLIIPFISYRINKSKLIEKIFRISRIPIISCKNDIEIIEKNCPKDKVVFVVLYIEKYVISGVLKDAQTEKDAFMLIKYWNKYKVYENGDAIRITSRTVKDRSIIVPMDKVNYYTYQYIGLCEKLPEEIF